MNNFELEMIINNQLNSAAFSDYTPNGLQVEGREKIEKIVTGVTACQALLDEAVRLQADAVIVHHGFFWKNEVLTIKGIKRQRLCTLLKNDINLYGWHLPLDVHSELGNNVQLARALGITILGEIQSLVLWGELQEVMSGRSMVKHISKSLGRIPLYCGDNAPEQIRRIAWCSGSGQNFIDIVAAFGMDAFITGEVSEQTIHSSRENGLHFFSAGHHATERGGILALGRWLTAQYQLNVNFIDIDNPV